jgi:hypothetical protein
MCVEKYGHDSDYNISTDSSKIAKAAFLLSTLWNVNDTITISFLPLPPANKMPKWYTMDLLRRTGTDLDSLETDVRSLKPVDAVKLIIRTRLQPLVGLKLEFVETRGDIRILFDENGGAWSHVGTQCKTVDIDKPTMCFGWLDVGTIIHEFCHALGMIHEHQNPFGHGIQWNEAKVYQWARITQGWDKQTTYLNIIERYKTDQVNGSEFDPKSIMLYFYPKELTIDGMGTKANHTLSFLDQEWLKHIYPQDGSERTFPTSLKDVSAPLLSIRPSSSTETWLSGLIVIVVVSIVFSHLSNNNKK